MSLARVHNFSISLDGFATGEGQSLDAPFGHAGERLHEWMFATRWGREMLGQSGGTSGINLGIARAFARAGAKIAVISRKQDKVDAAVAELKAIGGEAIGFSADVRDYGDRGTRLKGSLDSTLRLGDAALRHTLTGAVDYEREAFRNTTPFALNPDFDRTPAAKDPLGASVEGFLQAVRRDAPRPVVTGEEAIRALDLALAVEQALEEGGGREA